MSASEKLKALPLRGKDGRLNLTAALPQIVAVVEAAEIVMYEFHDVREYAEEKDLAAALSALEEVLS